jgi:hypothetical protein
MSCDPPEELLPITWPTNIGQTQTRDKDPSLLSSVIPTCITIRYFTYRAFNGVLLTVPYNLPICSVSPQCFIPTEVQVPLLLYFVIFPLLTHSSMLYSVPVHTTQC